MSSNPSVQSIVVQSTSALPLRSVESLKQYVKGILVICNTLIERMLDHPQESVLDRLVRTSLRFDIDAFDWWSVDRKKEKDQFSPGVYAELLCIRSQYGTSSPEEVAELVKNQLTFSGHEHLHLQPIVWAYLLQRLPPFDVHDGLLQIFFHAIPSSYWHANYILPPLFLARDELKICLTGDSRDHDVVDLPTAVETYLYPYIADVILRRFGAVKDSVFHSDPADEFPAPQDPRLYALLTIAGSPSTQTVSIADPYIDTFFGTVIRDIGVYMGVGSSRLYDDPGYDKMPSFRLDCNRYAVLKLLYTLVLSKDFSGSTSMRSEDQSILLVIFLRVLKSTFPRPRFLPDSEDWYTPYMASNFVRIAFQDNPWITRSGPTYLSHFKPAAELATFFFQFPPIIKEVFSHVVSRRLLDQISANRHNAYLELSDALPIIFDAFITGLASNSGISQMSIDYLFESDNLFRACTALVSCDKADSLRRLALLRPANDPAWPECLQKLDTVSERFEWPSFMEKHARTIADFREFVEGGCVGDFGGGYPPGRAPDKEKHLMGLRLMMKSPQKHWHRLRRPRSSGVTAEGTMHNGSKCE
ncbi:uncharacterized protein BT62DRAFT_996127 [Guyanagaster necrorhizus]|uniref:Uncharacterized protein n=1 Tax=Guyanagaster necrorhizus TaxID=856835 RepID=A0A9P8APG4_9AGAR|nr:uncharacterized protein BT62DRAFT_996127 [Guyanagaster necrorhizus MCA 3950]KAG7443313.1 hypothetical protein BT62DRAFT_996127 [Guyanagaster necrorhizus MCA 3950]